MRGIRRRSPIVALLVVVSFSVMTAMSVIARESETPFAGRVLMEAGSGTVLFESDAHRPWPPASMVKLMVVLLTMEAVANGRMHLDESVSTSAWASRMGGSQVYLREGEVFPLAELLKAVVIASANDAAVAIAEHVAGTTAAFVERMNARARELGLRETEYHSVHGLPPAAGQEDDLSTAYDLARLAREVMRYERVMEWASMVTAPFRNGSFQLTNTNRLVKWYRGANGLKTGYHRRAGYGVTATATRDGLTLIAVVLGASTRDACFDEAARLLTEGFSTYRLVTAAEAGQRVGSPIRVEGGDAPEVVAIASGELRLLLKRAEAPSPQVEVRVPRLLTAPVRQGQRLGEVVVVNGDETLGRTDLIADRDVKAAGWLGWWRNWRAARKAPP